MTAQHPFAATARLKAGGSVRAIWSTLPGIQLAETIAREPVDAIIFDMQHSAHDFASIRDGIAVTRLVGKPAAVRLALNDFGNASRFLDLGADITIAPMINNVADAKAYVAAAKYVPLGERSWGANRSMQLGGHTLPDYLTTANAQTLAFAMIETREALAQVDAILAVPGIDGVFVGPSDLSISLLNGEKNDATGPLVREAMATVLAAAKKAGKLTGCYAASLDMAKDAINKGWGLVSITNDVVLTRDAVKAALAHLEG